MDEDVLVLCVYVCQFVWKCRKYMYMYMEGLREGPQKVGEGKVL